MTLRLRTFGSVYLARDGELLSGPAGQRRLLAILTVLASVGERGISRDKLLALLWSEGDPDKSRHALTQSLYHMRKALGGERIFLAGGDLRLDPGTFSSDVGDFQQAVLEQRFADAVALYSGPFLDGFHLNGDPEFDFWVSNERDRFGRQFASAVAHLADDASRAGDFAAELQWRARLADHDPLDGAAVARYMACLISAGDHSAALQRARTYKTRLREELDLPPDRAVVELVAELKRNSQATSRAAETSAPAVEIPEIVAAPAPAAAPVSVESQPAPPFVAPAEAPRRRGWRGGLWLLTAAAVAFAAVMTRVAASRAASDRTSTRETTIMIAPFRVASSDPATAYLREGLLDLLTSRLAEPDAKRATDPARVLQAWKAAGYGSDSAVSLEATATIARSLDAGELVMGWVAGAGATVTIHASLVNAATSLIRAEVEVTGSPDSLIALTDRVVNGLILTEAGERLASFPHTERVAPPALRAFLSGRAAYRRADYHGAMRAYEQALAQAPTFARAALGLAMSADHANAAEQHDRGLAIALARRAELPVGDREYLSAFAGPRYPEPSSAAEALDAWEQAVRVAPDRAEGWHELGESFYYDGEVLGLSDGSERAAEAFRRALKLDPSFAPSRRMLTLLLARRADTTNLRALLADAGGRDDEDSTSVFVRWRAAMALGDKRALGRVRRAFDGAPNAALRSIAMTSQFDGVSIDDGDRALEILRRRPLTDAEEVDLALANHSRALNSGNVSQALAITDVLGKYQPALHPQLRLRVLDALYSSGDRTAAQTSEARLETLLATAPVTPADSAVRLADVCVVGQWKLSNHDTSAARSAVRALRAGGAPRFPVPVGASPSSCAELLDVSLAVVGHEASARDRLAHLDSLMLSGPAVSDAMRYANLIVARHYQSLGDPAHALAALRRRSYMRGWPRYRATGLQLQMNLALQMGDSASARSAYERLMATRRPPIVAEGPAPLVSRLRRFSRRLVD